MASIQGLERLMVARPLAGQPHGPIRHSTSLHDASVFNKIVTGFAAVATT
jgi:hypothetical protein